MKTAHLRGYFIWWLQCIVLWLNGNSLMVRSWILGLSEVWSRCSLVLCVYSCFWVCQISAVFCRTACILIALSSSSGLVCHAFFVSGVGWKWGEPFTCARNHHLAGRSFPVRFHAVLVIGALYSKSHKLFKLMACIFSKLNKTRIYPTWVMIVIRHPLKNCIFVPFAGVFIHIYTEICLALEYKGTAPLLTAGNVLKSLQHFMANIYIYNWLEFHFA